VTRLVDLDDVAGLERAWAELERLRYVRMADPDLRAGILRRLDHLDATVAEVIRTALDEWHPAVVLDAFCWDLVPEGPTIGVYRRLRALEAAA
jgi:hypothetical protein